MKRKKILSAALVLTGLFLFVFLMLRSTKNISLETNALPSKPLPQILIDPGHGGEDGGAVSGDVLEKEINLDISHDTANLFTFFGFDVSMTRTTDDALTNEGEDVKKRKYNDMKMRLELYDSSENNVIISIHQNKFSSAASNGTQVFYSPNHEQSGQLARCIQFSVKKLLQPENKRECKAAGSEIFLLKNTKNPAVLVECGFISNKSEREKLLDKEYQKEIALSIVTGFIDFYNTN